MKQMIMLFIVLFGIFLGTWTYKIKTPINRPDEYAEGVDEDAGAWWNTGKVEVDDSWKLDPEIPVNYIPVPGEEELYMVIDNDGNIIEYRTRTKQIDGSWVWKTVNPDIPDNYEPVPGLENVYKVTAEDGTVKYYKYIRNSNDTFAFVEVDEKGNILNHNTDATKIDANHVHITGNLYYLLDDNGVVIGGDKRVSNGDGTFTWMSIELDELPDINDVASQLQNFSFNVAEAPKLDTSAVDAMGQNMQNVANMPTDSSTSTEYYNITIPSNGGGNMTQYPSDPSQLIDQDALNYEMQQAQAQAAQNQQQAQSQMTTADQIYIDDVREQYQKTGTIDVTPNVTTVLNGDGTHTEEEVITETKNENGVLVTYKTIVKKTYDKDGTLIQSIKEGPYIIDSQQDLSPEPDAPIADPSKREQTLDAEYIRVGSKYSYQSDLQSQVFTLLNAQRTKNGISALQQTDTAQKIAATRAADMATYGVSEENLPTYGPLADMLSYYSVSAVAPGENLWKTSVHTADDIHSRLQAIESTRKTRMNSSATQYGLAIIYDSSSGAYYICEVFL